MAALLDAERRREYLRDQASNPDVQLPAYQQLFVQGCWDHIACLVDAEKQRLFLKQCKTWGLTDYIATNRWGNEVWGIFDMVRGISRRHRRAPLKSLWRDFSRRRMVALDNNQNYGVCLSF